MPPTAAMTFTLAHALNPMSSDSKLNVLLLGLRVAGVCLGLPVVAAVVAGVVLGESAGNTLMLSSVMASSSAVIPPTLLMAGLLPMALFQTLAVMVSSSLAGFFLYRATLPRLHATHIRIRVLAALWAIVLATVQLTVI
ncbi:MAG: uncharacterized protein KVP18_000552 [Porospora cf. gigantea A]|nr:MAG: hypothetical protein KVP18_000552 [Porospora cf. gigantea A]